VITVTAKFSVVPLARAALLRVVALALQAYCRMTSFQFEQWRLSDPQSEVLDPSSLLWGESLIAFGAGSGTAEAELETSPKERALSVPSALDNGQRSPRKLLRALIARLLGRKP
jgi:hypothetical protein